MINVYLSLKVGFTGSLNGVNTERQGQLPDIRVPSTPPPPPH